MKKILLSFFTVSLIANCFAQTILIEDFNYAPIDTLASTNVNNNWVNISSTVNRIRANGTGLTFPGYNGSGIGASASLTNNGEDCYRNLTSVVSNQNVYYSFLLNVSAAQATGDYFTGLSTSTSASAYSGRTFIKSNGTGYSLGISKINDPAPVYSTTVLSFNTTYLVVWKCIYSSGTTTDDQFGLYVFNSAIPTTEPTTFDVGPTVATGADPSNYAKVFLRQGNSANAPTLTIDGMRVSTTWANGPLPVKYTQFTADRNNDNVKLNWSTASEVNNNGFEIERSSNGTDFEKIGFVKGVGNSSRLNKYSFTDKNNSSAYYRLKQVDFDGKYEFSKVLTVKSNESSVELSPNPFNDNLVINSNNTIINAEIVDITGRVKMFEVVNNNTAKLNTSGLDNGVYFIRINNGEKVITKRIIKN
jgi:hypothetical protein